MALMKDEDGRLWDVDLNGKKHSPNFGQEVGSELIDGLPLAMGIAKTVLKGMDKGLAAMSSKRANAILSDEEKAQLEKARAEAKVSCVTRTSWVLGAMHISPLTRRCSRERHASYRDISPSGLTPPFCSSPAVLTCKRMSTHLPCFSACRSISLAKSIRSTE